jgi:hypothetical protein
MLNLVSITAEAMFKCVTVISNFQASTPILETSPFPMSPTGQINSQLQLIPERIGAVSKMVSV